MVKYTLNISFSGLDISGIAHASKKVVAVKHDADGGEPPERDTYDPRPKIRIKWKDEYASIIESLEDK
jgi:hypothetical protein